eukprot:PhM_4_TR10070/c0_g1_i2/m.46906
MVENTGNLPTGASSLPPELPRHAGGGGGLIDRSFVRRVAKAAARRTPWAAAIACLSSSTTNSSSASSSLASGGNGTDGNKDKDSSGEDSAAALKRKVALQLSVVQFLTFAGEWSKAIGMYDEGKLPTITRSPDGMGMLMRCFCAQSSPSSVSSWQRALGFVLDIHARAVESDGAEANAADRTRTSTATLIGVAEECWGEGSPQMSSLRTLVDPTTPFSNNLSSVASLGLWAHLPAIFTRVPPALLGDYEAELSRRVALLARFLEGAVMPWDADVLRGVASCMTCYFTVCTSMPDEMGSHLALLKMLLDGRQLEDNDIRRCRGVAALLSNQKQGAGDGNGVDHFLSIWILLRMNWRNGAVARTQLPLRNVKLERTSDDAWRVSRAGLRALSVFASEAPRPGLWTAQHMLGFFRHVGCEGSDDGSAPHILLYLDWLEEHYPEHYMDSLRSHATRLRHDVQTAEKHQRTRLRERWAKRQHDWVAAVKVFLEAPARVRAQEYPLLVQALGPAHCDVLVRGVEACGLWGDDVVDHIVSKCTNKSWFVAHAILSLHLRNPTKSRLSSLDEALRRMHERGVDTPNVTHEMRARFCAVRPERLLGNVSDMPRWEDALSFLSCVDDTSEGQHYIEAVWVALCRVPSEAGPVLQKLWTVVKPHLSSFRHPPLPVITEDRLIALMDSRPGVSLDLVHSYCMWVHTPTLCRAVVRAIATLPDGAGASWLKKHALNHLKRDTQAVFFLAMAQECVYTAHPPTRDACSQVLMGLLPQLSETTRLAIMRTCATSVSTCALVVPTLMSFFDLSVYTAAAEAALRCSDFATSDVTQKLLNNLYDVGEQHSPATDVHAVVAAVLHPASVDGVSFRRCIAACRRHELLPAALHLLREHEAHAVSSDFHQVFEMCGSCWLSTVRYFENADERTPMPDEKGFPPALESVLGHYDEHKDPANVRTIVHWMVRSYCCLRPEGLARIVMSCRKYVGTEHAPVVAGLLAQLYLYTRRVFWGVWDVDAGPTLFRFFVALPRGVFTHRRVFICLFVDWLLKFGHVLAEVPCPFPSQLKHLIARPEVQSAIVAYTSRPSLAKAAAVQSAVVRVYVQRSPANILEASMLCLHMSMRLVTAIPPSRSRYTGSELSAAHHRLDSLIRSGTATLGEVANFALDGVHMSREQHSILLAGTGGGFQDILPVVANLLAAGHRLTAEDVSSIAAKGPEAASAVSTLRSSLAHVGGSSAASTTAVLRIVDTKWKDAINTFLRLLDGKGELMPAVASQRELEGVLNYTVRLHIEQGGCESTLFQLLNMCASRGLSIRGDVAEQLLLTPWVKWESTIEMERYLCATSGATTHVHYPAIVSNAWEGALRAAVRSPKMLKTDIEGAPTHIVVGLVNRLPQYMRDTVMMTPTWAAVRVALASQRLSLPITADSLDTVEKYCIEHGTNYHHLIHLKATPDKIETALCRALAHKTRDVWCSAARVVSQRVANGAWSHMNLLLEPFAEQPGLWRLAVHVMQRHTEAYGSASTRCFGFILRNVEKSAPVNVVEAFRAYCQRHHPDVLEVVPELLETLMSTDWENALRTLLRRPNGDDVAVSAKFMEIAIPVFMRHGLAHAVLVALSPQHAASRTVGELIKECARVALPNTHARACEAFFRPGQRVNSIFSTYMCTEAESTRPDDWHRALQLLATAARASAPRGALVQAQRSLVRRLSSSSSWVQATQLILLGDTNFDPVVASHVLDIYQTAPARTWEYALQVARSTGADDAVWRRVVSLAQSLDEDQRGAVAPALVALGPTRGSLSYAREVLEFCISCGQMDVATTVVGHHPGLGGLLSGVTAAISEQRQGNLNTPAALEGALERCMTRGDWCGALLALNWAKGRHDVDITVMHLQLVVALLSEVYPGDMREMWHKLRVAHPRAQSTASLYPLVFRAVHATSGPTAVEEVFSAASREVVLDRDTQIEVVGYLSGSPATWVYALEIAANVAHRHRTMTRAFVGNVLSVYEGVGRWEAALEFIQTHSARFDAPLPTEESLGPLLVVNRFDPERVLHYVSEANRLGLSFSPKAIAAVQHMCVVKYGADWMRYSSMLLGGDDVLQRRTSFYSDSMLRLKHRALYAELLRLGTTSWEAVLVTAKEARDELSLLEGRHYDVVVQSCATSLSPSLACSVFDAAWEDGCGKELLVASYRGPGVASTHVFLARVLEHLSLAQSSGPTQSELSGEHSVSNVASWVRAARLWSTGHQVFKVTEELQAMLCSVLRLVYATDPKDNIADLASVACQNGSSRARQGALWVLAQSPAHWARALEVAATLPADTIGASLTEQLMGHLLAAGHWSGAIGLFHGIPHDHSQRTQRLLSLVHRCVETATDYRAGDAALALYESIRNEPKLEGTASYCAILAGCLKVRPPRWAAALNMLKVMETELASTVPLEAYTTVLACLATPSQWQRAMLTAAHFLRTGVPLDVPCFVCVLRSRPPWEEAVRVLETAETSHSLLNLNVLRQLEGNARHDAALGPITALLSERILRARREVEPSIVRALERDEGLD